MQRYIIAAATITNLGRPSEPSSPMFVVDLETSQILILLLELHIFWRSPHLVSDPGVQPAGPMTRVPSFPPVLLHPYVLDWDSPV